MSIKTIREAVGAGKYMSNLEARRSFYFMFYSEMGFTASQINADMKDMSEKELIAWFNALR